MPRLLLFSIPLLLSSVYSTVFFEYSHLAQYQNMTLENCKTKFADRTYGLAYCQNVALELTVIHPRYQITGAVTFTNDSQLIDADIDKTGFILLFQNQLILRSFKQGIYQLQFNQQINPIFVRKKTQVISREQNIIVILAQISAPNKKDELINPKFVIITRNYGLIASQYQVSLPNNISNANILLVRESFKDMILITDETQEQTILLILLSEGYVLMLIAPFESAKFSFFELKKLESVSNAIKFVERRGEIFVLSQQKETLKISKFYLSTITRTSLLYYGETKLAIHLEEQDSPDLVNLQVIEYRIGNLLLIHYQSQVLLIKSPYNPYRINFQSLIEQNGQEFNSPQDTKYVIILKDSEMRSHNMHMNLLLRFKKKINDQFSIPLCLPNQNFYYSTQYCSSEKPKNKFSPLSITFTNHWIECPQTKDLDINYYDIPVYSAIDCTLHCQLNVFKLGLMFQNTCVSCEEYYTSTIDNSTLSQLYNITKNNDTYSQINGQFNKYCDLQCNEGFVMYNNLCIADPKYSKLNDNCNQYTDCYSCTLAVNCDWNKNEKTCKSPNYHKQYSINEVIEKTIKYGQINILIIILLQIGIKGGKNQISQQIFIFMLEFQYFMHKKIFFVSNSQQFLKLSYFLSKDRILFQDQLKFFMQLIKQCTDDDVKECYIKKSYLQGEIKFLELQAFENTICSFRIQQQENQTNKILMDVDVNDELRMDQYKNQSYFINPSIFIQICNNRVDSKNQDCTTQQINSNRFRPTGISDEDLLKLFIIVQNPFFADQNMGNIKKYNSYLLFNFVIKYSERFFATQQNNSNSYSRIYLHYQKSFQSCTRNWQQFYQFPYNQSQLFNISYYIMGEKYYNNKKAKIITVLFQWLFYAISFGVLLICFATIIVKLKAQSRRQNVFNEINPANELSESEQQESISRETKNFLSNDSLVHRIDFDPAEKLEYEQNECPICLDKFVLKEPLIRLNCKHIFHTNCLESWVKKSIQGQSIQCPLCKEVQQ